MLPFELWDNTASDVLRWVTHGLMAAALAVTIVTAVQYVRDAVELRRTARSSA